jgi:hypothetical protein
MISEYTCFAPFAVSPQMPFVFQTGFVTITPCSSPALRAALTRMYWFRSWFAGNCTRAARLGGGSAIEEVATVAPIRPMTSLLERDSTPKAFRPPLIWSSSAGACRPPCRSWARGPCCRVSRKHAVLDAVLWKGWAKVAPPSMLASRIPAALEAVRRDPRAPSRDRSEETLSGDGDSNVRMPGSRSAP